MTGMVLAQVPKMRALAARLRTQSAETGITLYRRKLEELASELEEAAAEAQRLSDGLVKQVPRRRSGRGAGN